MKSIITLLLLWVCSASSEPLGAAIQRRSSRNGVYARDYARGYNRVSYVAIPLHAPLPVLHVLSPTPLYRPARGVHRLPDQPRVYAASMPHAWYAPPPTPILDGVETAPEPEILYARPNPRGGFYYSKRPTKKRVPVIQEPIIIRVHKHRIIRDR